MDFDYYRNIFNQYIYQNIIMAVLRKANFHLVDIWRMMKNQSCKRRLRRKFGAWVEEILFDKLNRIQRS